MGKKLRPEEEWALACLKAALPELTVCPWDDGSKPGMHDINLYSPDKVLQGAVEVTAAADGDAIKLWKLVNGEERCVYPGLAGGWVLRLRPSTRAKDLLRNLRALLADWEHRGVQEFSASWNDQDPTFVQASRLGIVTARQGATDFAGSVYFIIELPQDRTGGVVAPNGDALAQWVGDWLHGTDRKDVRQKLAASGAPRGHAFVLFPGFTTAPFAVSDLLMRDSAPLPTITPNLPAEVTDVWAMSTLNTGDGFRWSPDGGWAKFPKLAKPYESTSAA
ncbi:hypothetical protein [Streptosporangium sp. NBC_01469]|uniref:hypothetical protein n=1 Tax=Streptosporangium sp. NBC_01469 TaxID=2903898 RepID=UPI002E2DB06C|nr:hypothetical protein [Streptosporangium sp. NBC_01469]